MLSKDFFFAGDATFTAANNKGDHYTFRVEKKEATDQYPEMYFGHVLTGPNNESDYTFIGRVLPGSRPTIKVTPKAAKNHDKARAVLAWVLKLAEQQQPLPEGYSVQHDGKCARCGRKLTNPVSLETGLGPECATKV